MFDNFMNTELQQRIDRIKSECVKENIAAETPFTPIVTSALLTIINHFRKMHTANRDDEPWLSGDIERLMESLCDQWDTDSE